MPIDWTKVITVSDKFAQAKEAKKQEIASARYAQETGGCDWTRTSDGETYRIATDDRACVKVSNAREIAILAGNSYVPQQWKTLDGFITATLADLTEMGVAMAAHVQAAFSREATLLAQIEAVTTQAELGAITWATE